MLVNVNKLEKKYVRKSFIVKETKSYIIFLITFEIIISFVRKRLIENVFSNWQLVFSNLANHILN